LAKITAYQSMQNLCQTIKYSLINSGKWLHVISNITLHVNMAPLAAKDQLLIKTLQTKKMRLLIE